MNKRSIMMLIAALALIASNSMPTLAAGISIPDYQPNHPVSQVFTEDFSPTLDSKKPSNIGSWGYNDIDKGAVDRNNGVGDIAQANHGEYVVQVPIFAQWTVSHPSFGTHNLSSPFTGNYFKKGVLSLSVDIRVTNDLIFKGERPITLVLRGKDGYTLYKTMYYCEPKNGGTACPNVPNLPVNLTRYTFHIPKHWEEAKQTGWGVYNLYNHELHPKLRKHFNDVMSDVQKVDFMLGAPRLIYGLQFVAVEATNVTITTMALQ